MCLNDFSKELNRRCQTCSDNWDHRFYFKRHKSNGMCVKVLFEILAMISEKHGHIYEQIKNIIWSDYLKMVYGPGLIEEFEKHGMQRMNKPIPGAFIFFRTGNIIGHVGLCVDRNKFWHLCKKGFICENIGGKDIAAIGAF